MAKQTYRASSKIEGLRGAKDVIEAGDRVDLDEKQAADLLAPKGPLELYVPEPPPPKSKAKDEGGESGGKDDGK